MNLNALDSRFLRTCCSRLESVCMRRRQRRSATSIDEVDALAPRPRGGTCVDVVVQIGEAHFADVEHDRAGFDLRQVENVVDQRQQVVAGRVDRLGEFDLLAA